MSMDMEPASNPEMLMRRLRPAIAHGVLEWAYGAPPAHVIAQTAAIGYFMGEGQMPREAIRRVERLERTGALPVVYGRPTMAPYQRVEYYQRAGWPSYDPDPDAGSS